MGQKVHPYGLRLGYNKTWLSRWYAEKEYADLLYEDLALRDVLKRRLSHGGVSKVEIERAANKLKISISTSQDGQAGEFRVNQATEGDQYFPSVAMDAVGNFVLDLYRLFKLHGITCRIYANRFDPELRGLVQPVCEALLDAAPQDLILYNFSIFDPYVEAIASLGCKKLLYYHGITPARFFQIYDALTETFIVELGIIQQPLKVDITAIEKTEKPEFYIFKKPKITDKN